MHFFFKLTFLTHGDCVCSRMSSEIVGVFVLQTGENPFTISHISLNYILNRNNRKHWIQKQKLGKHPEFTSLSATNGTTLLLQRLNSIQQKLDQLVRIRSAAQQTPSAHSHPAKMSNTGRHGCSFEPIVYAGRYLF